MKSLHKIIKRVLRYEIGVFLKNSDLSYLYGSISYLFGYEKNRCFFLKFLQEQIKDIIIIARAPKAHELGLDLGD